MMKIVNCSFDRHAQPILDIFNDAIQHSTALYEYQLRTMNTMYDWFANKANNQHPVIGAEDDNSNFLGFASYGTFRAWPAYKYSIEHSVYVSAQYRGQGVGNALMTELIDRATRRDYHVMIGGIDTDNKASVALHEKLGFVHAGTITQAGFKFGRWLDLAFYQLTLTTPSSPIDG